MSARMDAIGNVVGRYEGTAPKAPALLLGSHFDSVRNAGRWDGPLGVITAIACVADLNHRGKRLPFAIEIAAFADEEGVRFPATLLGSRALAGTFDERALSLRDRDGISMREAMQSFGLDPEHIGAAARARGEYLAYLELHIEQGPVLEAEGLPRRRRHRDQRRHAAARHARRHGRARGNGADGDAPRRARGRRRMHRRHRTSVPERHRPVRHGRDGACRARRDQRHSGPMHLHHRHALRLRRAPPHRGHGSRPQYRACCKGTRPRAADRRRARTAHDAVRRLAAGADHSRHHPARLSPDLAAERRRTRRHGGRRPSPISA